MVNDKKSHHHYVLIFLMQNIISLSSQGKLAHHCVALQSDGSEGRAFHDMNREEVVFTPQKRTVIQITFFKKGSVACLEEGTFAVACTLGNFEQGWFAFLNRSV